MEILISALLNIGLTLGAYFYDFKGANRRNKVFSLLIFSAMLFMLISWQSLLLVNRIQDKKALQTLNTSLETKLKQKEAENQQLKNQLQTNLIKNNISNPTPVKPSHAEINLKSLNIQYFQRDIDSEKLTNRLKDLQTNSEIKQLIIFNCELQDCDYQTNAIWYGSSVEIEQVKQIAKILISSGLNIKVIQPFFEPEKKDNHLIQIGTEKRAFSCKTWQKEAILTAKTFPNNRLGCPN